MKSTANIIYLSNIVNQYNLTYNICEGGQQFLVHMPGIWVVFCWTVEFVYRRYISDCNAIVDSEETPQARANIFKIPEVERPNDHNFTLVNNVIPNQEGFTNLKFLKENLSHKILVCIVCLSNQNFQNIVSTKNLLNYPIAIDNINSDNKTFGPNVASKKVKMLHWTQHPVNIDYVAPPQDILNLNHGVSFAAGILFVNRLGFMITVSQ